MERPRSHLVGRVATVRSSALDDGLLGGSPEGKLHEGRNFCHHIQSRIARLVHNSHSITTRSMNEQGQMQHRGPSDLDLNSSAVG